MCYGYDSAGERFCAGAMMGRPDVVPDDAGTVQRLRLERVRLYDGACYDKGGAYWGNGQPLYCAWGESDTEQCQLFIRADSREGAKIAALMQFPNAKFHN